MGPVLRAIYSLLLDLLNFVNGVPVSSRRSPGLLSRDIDELRRVMSH